MQAYASFKNEQCQKCHRNILNIPDKRGAMLAHRSVLYAPPGYEKRCIFMEEARHLIETNQKAYIAEDYPNATGVTTKPKEVFPDSK